MIGMPKKRSKTKPEAKLSTTGTNKGAQTREATPSKGREYEDHYRFNHYTRKKVTLQVVLEAAEEIIDIN